MAPTHKPVQDIIQSGVVPKCYIQHEDDYQAASSNGPPPLMDAPTIDFSLLSSSSYPHDELANLRSALSSWGCVQLVNHGMPPSLLDEVREMSKQFFKLPLEEKEKYSSKGDDLLEGYGNTNAVQRGSLNWNDKLHLQVYPEDKRQLQFWPENPQQFRTILHEYSKRNRMILEMLLKAMARSLNLEENSFLQFRRDENEDMAFARFNFYPKCPLSDQVVGLKPHGDGTYITMLLLDNEVEGLQVNKDNTWFRVPIIPQALTILVGDQMEITSNGIFKSPTHKAVVNPQYDRISLAMLFKPSRDKEIGPLDKLIDEERLQLYKRLKDYSQFYSQCIPPLGERPISKVKINNH
ncbi:probable 2-oxoglutarate-dependent dioxygenase ANS [Chenopodium quinoa]|uniref:Fe2OG dioxygenase domain-containing protein n=1 Tax=Chenopodium quinoa TaxID=63459 RepID=A0A803MXP5_CHEQI|nr:probable 2-oxoglutarate-dependent dioxygenase ANS [Chenopodium quinoa]